MVSVDPIDLDTQETFGRAFPADANVSGSEGSQQPVEFAVVF
jgi:hypothetical protein